MWRDACTACVGTVEQPRSGVWQNGEGIGKLRITSQRNYSPFVVVHMDPRPSQRDPRRKEPVQAVREPGKETGRTRTKWSLVVLQ